ncbi:restriction endonuclease [Haloactinomyces albus]|uniref:Restriction endonuclease type IV Mrr domain-containing protein n=1 Tax=Haloactinomyces albus TaxID=1352928 RepID=A0AAE3ZB00_9ACTN|nr:restriction endonuclease [Haloactinomyces albus]MDR7300413.1 hypothetical protein [Haloactinomyces albus]
MSPGSQRRISASAYQALRDALPVIVWYKRSFRQYLTTALRDHPELLYGVDFDLSKREVADEVVGRLMRTEDSYQSATLKLMLEVANTSSFHELQHLEDGEYWVKKAQTAVTQLKDQTRVYEELIMERERVAAERTEHAKHAELQRKFAGDLADLNSDFYSLSGKNEQPQERGRQFEVFLNRLFDLFDLQPRLSYVVNWEQIDGAFSFDTDDYIVEAKWTQGPIEVKEADHFAEKVRQKGKNALGLFVSIGGFSRGILDKYSRSTPFMTMDGMDLICVLEQRVRLDTMLRRKKRHANETGQCYFPANKLID